MRTVSSKEGLTINERTMITSLLPFAFFGSLSRISMSVSAIAARLFPIGLPL